MAEARVFIQTLSRCGLNDTSANYLATTQFDSPNQLARISPTRFDQLTKELSKRTGLPDGVSFPFIAMLQLRGFHAWLLFRQARGQELLAGLFTGEAMLTQWTNRVEQVDQYRKADQNDTIAPPPPLKDLDNWPTWEEKWVTYIQRHRNMVTGVPLIYVIREEEEVTDEARDQRYPTIDDNLIATTLLAGDTYESDNQRVFDLLKPLILDGPAWSYAAGAKRARDGRRAFLAIKQQAEGLSAKTTRRSKAYASIDSARFTGKGRYTFDQYIARHQRGYNELADLGEPVAETKKVQDFLKGISDPRLQASKSVIYGDEAKLTSFQLCQQYMKTVLNNMKSNANQGEDNRVVASTTTNQGNRRRKHTRHYSKTEWAALSDSERANIMKQREENKKRKAAAVSRASDGDKKVTPAPAPAPAPANSHDLPPGLPPPPQGNNAGDNFGRYAHRNN